MTAKTQFEFARGNATKLLAIPLYLLGWALSFFVPRARGLWVFGSAAGVAEGALAVAQERLRRLEFADDQDAANPRTVWLVNSDSEAETATHHGFEAVRKHTLRGFWVTLRAEILVVTHGLGDVNRYGMTGGTIVQLWHGAPLKRIHFDSPVTLNVNGPKFLRPLLRAMYTRGARSVSLYVAGSQTAAQRLRSAFRVDPGKVLICGDPRDDALAAGPVPDLGKRQQLIELLDDEQLAAVAAKRFLLWAPTWRDGDEDLSIPDSGELAELNRTLEELNAALLVRPHPLSRGAYETLYNERIRPFPAETVTDPTPWLAVFDTVITDYSSIAVDYALTEQPIVWFAPDVAKYVASRGLYEPLEVTTEARVDTDWQSVCARLTQIHTRGHPEAVLARNAARNLKQRFHAYSDGKSAARVVDEIERLLLPDAALVPERAVFFESFYGTSVSCNPAALDREIARRYPDVPRYWSVTSETTEVPDGAQAVLVGSRLWHAARAQAGILIVNDWLRFGFRRKKHQFVLQTWHGTMLKQLALGRPKVSLRTRIAIHREARRWSEMLSQNHHSTAYFRSSYAFRGEIHELGYPRNDVLARSVEAGARIPIHTRNARRSLGICDHETVVLYAPTWRDTRVSPSQLLDADALKDALEKDLGGEVTLLLRGHSRAAAAGIHSDTGVRDVSSGYDLNDVLLAADILVTDYSSVMFDASVANIPMVFYTPDFDHYATAERGFTFDFLEAAPGPVVREEAELAAAVAASVRNTRDGGVLTGAYGEKYAAWKERFNPHDDGLVSARVVDELAPRFAKLPASPKP